jgi:hypothetical protein
MKFVSSILVLQITQCFKAILYSLTTCRACILLRGNSEGLRRFLALAASQVLHLRCPALSTWLYGKPHLQAVLLGLPLPLPPIIFAQP